MTMQLTRLYTVLIAGLAVLGLFASGHLFELLNSDIAIDIFRVALAAYLMYVSFVAKSEGMAHVALYVVGFTYVGIALAGLISPTVGGLLPTGLTGFDIAFHLASGALAIGAATIKDKHIIAHA
jgi:hypothetical protein